MIQSLLKSEIKAETDIVRTRSKAREIGAFLKFDLQEQTRIATAVSEITRNTFQYAKSGTIEYSVILENQFKLCIIIKDKGPGISNIKEIINGTYISPEGMGVGLMGAKRLMDDFEIHTKPTEGTTIVMKKIIPFRSSFLNSAELNSLTSKLMVNHDSSPMEELQRQNKEILLAVAELNEKKEELLQLNEELEATNRGVVALYAELDERAEFLRQASESKTSFLSDMTHEFRSPLNSILGISQIVLSEAKAQKAIELEKQMSFIIKAAEGLSNLVNDLLDIAKIEAGKIQVKISDFTVNDLFGALRGLMRPLNVNEHVVLNLHDSDERIILHSDEAKISQVLRNLISNAIKYTEKGNVTVSAYLKDENVCFQVSDTGYGISSEHLEDIFQEFVQIDNPLQEKSKGTGLGLPLSKKLTTLLGGTITVESEVGKGSTFFLTLPRKYVGPNDAPYFEIPDKKKEAIRNHLDPKVLGNKKILVIDDDDSNLYAIQRNLQDLNIDYREAHNGKEGLSIAQSYAPDLIILDLIMPEMDGFEFLQESLRSKTVRNIPIILHTSKPLEPEERDYLNQVTIKIVPKDLSSNFLKDAVQDFLQNSSAKNL